MAEIYGMTVIDWPRDLRPASMTHYFKPHIGGSKSPLTRSRKVYELSAPIWTGRMTFKADWRGGVGTSARGARLDALLQQLKGGAVLTRLFDYRRPYPAGLTRYYAQMAGESWTFGMGETFGAGEEFILPPGSEPVNEAASVGATELVFAGFMAGETVFHAGDFFGGDGRLHMVMADAVADGTGRAAVTFDPPLDAALLAGAAVTFEPRGLYQITSEDAGAAEAFARNPHAGYTVDFEEYRQ